MPEPLAIPVTAALPDRKDVLASLGRESVVRMASANWRRWSMEAPARAIKGFKWVVIFAVGKGTPMMPVDEGKTCVGGIPSSRAVAAHVVLQARIPGCPVAQLALPELTRTARTRPTLFASAER